MIIKIDDKYEKLYPFIEADGDNEEQNNIVVRSNSRRGNNYNDETDNNVNVEPDGDASDSNDYNNDDSDDAGNNEENDNDNNDEETNNDNNNDGGEGNDYNNEGNNDNDNADDGADGDQDNGDGGEGNDYNNEGNNEGGDGENPEDNNEENADNSTDNENTKRFSMYIKYTKLYNNLSVYIDKLKNVVSDDLVSNTTVRVVANNLEDLKTNLYDFMTIKFKTVDYIKILTFFETALSIVKLNFELLRNNKINIKH